jgi:hypothetical protein
MASGQHATLLLGAYIKQNAKDKINSFVEKIGSIENFNIEQAIKVRIFIGLINWSIFMIKLGSIYM